MAQKYFIILAILSICNFQLWANDKNNAILGNTYREYLKAISELQENPTLDYSEFNDSWYKKFSDALSDPSSKDSKYYLPALDALSTIAFANGNFEDSLSWANLLLSQKNAMENYPRLRIYHLTKAKLLNELYKLGKSDKGKVNEAYEYAMNNHAYVFQSNEEYITANYEYLEGFLKDANPELCQEKSLEAIKYIKSLDKNEFLRIYSGLFRYTSIERFASLYFELSIKLGKKNDADKLAMELMASDRSDHIVMITKYAKSLNLDDKGFLGFIVNALDFAEEPMWLRNIYDYTSLSAKLAQNGFTADSLLLTQKTISFIEEMQKSGLSISDSESIGRTASRLSLILKTTKESLRNENN